jgi:hypothetical protein
MTPLFLPAPRGPWSRWVLDAMLGFDSAPPGPRPDGLSDDAQFALYLCYEVQYAGLPGTEHAEWNTTLIEARRHLEGAFEAALRQQPDTLSPDAYVSGRTPERIGRLVTRLLDGDDGPSLSRFMEHEGTIDQMRDIILHRSPYQLKAGDPHTAGVQRLSGRAKQLLVQMIQAGEYGTDAPTRWTHAELYADTMQVFGLSPTPNAYLDVLPGHAFAISNLGSMFGFNRRWRGALVGHLAACEMTSVTPMQRYALALERLGVPERARRFYDVHVSADAGHASMALEMVEAQCRAEPVTAGDIVFGVQSTLAVERWFAEGLFHDWSARGAYHRPTAAAS